MTDHEKWEAEFSAIPDLRVWNNNVVPWMHERGEEYKRYAHAEAKRRGYEGDKAIGGYRMPWQMHALRGHNCIAAGWREGVLRIAFAGKDGARFYCYEGVPEAEFFKLRNSPYPDRLFTTNIKNKDYKITAE